MRTRDMISEQEARHGTMRRQRYPRVSNLKRAMSKEKRGGHKLRKGGRKTEEVEETIIA